MKTSELVDTLRNQMRIYKLPVPLEEYKFHESRLWRFDFAWLPQKIAVEVEGGIWIRGRHNRGAGFIRDCDKYNEAAKLGWKVFRFTEWHINNLQAIDFLVEYFENIS